MGCGTTCVKIIFSIFNTLVLLGGIAIAVLGGIFRWGSEVLQADAEKALDGIKASGYDVHEALSALALTLFIAGLVVVFIALIGLLGVCCKWRAALVIYCIFLILIIILEVVPAIIFLVMEGTFQKAFNVGMEKNIKLANDGNADFRSSIEYLMVEYECCKVGDSRLVSPPSKNCGLTNESYDKDCYTAIKDKITQNGVAMAAIAIAIIVVEIFCVIFAIVLFRAQRKEMVV